MNKLIKYIALSVALHIALVAFLLIGIGLPSRNLDDDPGIGIPVEAPIQAVSVDEQQVERQLERLRQAEAQERAAEQARQRQIEEEQRRAREAAEREQQRRAEAERQRQQEERRLEELREQQRQEEVRLRELQEQERAKQAELERLERERQAEEQRRQEEERQRAEEERRRQEEAERQRREEEQRRAEEERRRQEAEEAERQRRMEEEAFQRRLEQAQTTYGAAIIREVSQAWSRPPGSPTGLSARINIRLAPDGSVLAAEVIESSGHPAFDRSAELAVRRASPLSVPSDPDIFAQFRNINFTFTPPDE